jgi:predicted metal-dependent hydrolase
MRIEEIPDEMIDFSYGNAYNLDELVAEVKKEMFNDNYGTDIPVSWTKKPYKGYFGQYRWTKDNDLSKSYININCILNSNKIKREVVKFVIYHELLHRDNHTHNKEFKSAEHRYPDWPEIERVLFNDFINYDIKEW